MAVEKPLNFDEKVADWNDLLDAEARRTNVAKITDEKWVENFTTTKHQMLKSIDERIVRLRNKWDWHLAMTDSKMG